MKLWSGRFGKETDALVNDFNASIQFDQRLYKEDITGSLAHAKMLGDCGIISQEDVTGRINWLTSAIIDGNTAEDFIVRAENAYCPPTNQVRDVVLAAVDDLISKL